MIHRVRLQAGALFLMVTLAPVLQVLALEIVLPPDASQLERLAAREVMRYVYLRTGNLPDLHEGGTATAPGIVVARKDRTLAGEIGRELNSQQFAIKTLSGVTWIVGGDDVGTLYGAYRFAEVLGVRFYLHGDVVPDGRLAAIPDIDETGKPLFVLRGLNSWGWHPQGIDAWNADDYKAIFTQLTKMRMNFLGVHCYPEGHPMAEPTVWHGLTGDFDERGRVTSSYPSRYYNTVHAPKAEKYHPTKTDDFHFGADRLFDDEAWAPDVMRGMTPLPSTPDEYHRALAKTRCAMGAENPESVLNAWTEAYTRLLEIANTNGTFGMVVNMETNAGWGPAVAKTAGKPFPREYLGKARLIVPCVRSIANQGESLKMRIIALSREPVESVTVHVRPMGKGAWAAIPARHVARAVYEANLPRATEDIEYYVSSGNLVWPATAPTLNQTVVVME